MKKELLILFILLIPAVFALDQANAPSSVSIDQGITVLADTFDGVTTYFMNMSDSDLAVISNLTLERASYGKIIFDGVINLTQDAVSNVIDIDSNVNISYNFISVNALNLTSLNGSAVLYLYNLSFSNPRVLLNGSVCPIETCPLVVYSNHNLAFRAAYYGQYSAEETPSTPVTPPAGGGGPSGGASVTSNFEVDKDMIKVLIKQGESWREEIRVKNTGNTLLRFKVSSSLSSFTAISDSGFSLNPGEEKIIKLDIFAKGSERPDAYIGRISIEASGIIKNINFILEVKERKALFDITSRVVKKRVGVGESVKANITLENVGDLDMVDVLLYYSIMDFNNKTLSFTEESLAVERSLNIVRKIKADLPPGSYAFYSRAFYGNRSASSSDFFEVEKRGINFVFILAVIILVAAGLIIFILIRRKKKQKKLRPKVELYYD